jgi:hypothetical protein
VRSLYVRAAQQDLDGAWSLATENARAQFGARSTFDGTFATLRSIRFGRAQVQARTPTTATVAIATVATHTNKVDTCAGSVQTVRSGDQWLVDRIDVDCDSSG